MRKLFVLAALMFVPAFAAANVARDAPKSPAKYVVLHTPITAVANGAGVARVTYPFAGGGRLVDVIVFQNAAGSTGTSWTFDVQTTAGTSVMTTAGVITQASGVYTVTDAKGSIALPSGWTRPVLKTDATVTVAKGAALTIYTTETGAYSPHPTGIFTLVFEPLQ